MALNTGLDGQIGIAEETTYGTYVAPTDFFEFNSASVTPNVETIVPTSLGRGVYRRASRRESFITGGASSVNLDLVNKGLGLWFKHMIGNVATTQPDPTNQPNHYVHTFTPLEGLKGRYLTVQVGVPPTDGSIEPFTGLGARVTSWEISAAVDEAATLSTTMDLKTVDVSQTLETPSYPSGLRTFTFLSGSLTLDGSAFGVLSSLTISGDNPANTNRRGFGNTKFEPLANDFWSITGSFESEFENRDAYDAWVAGTEQANLIATFEISGSEIDSGQSNPYQIIVTIPSIFYTGDAPTVDGPDVISQTKPFEAMVNDAGDDIITVEYHNDDTSV